MFCSRSVSVHLLRGAAGLALLCVALFFDALHPGLRVAAAVVAVVLLRGCPMCWLAGLFETWAQRRNARSNGGLPS